MSHFDDDPPPYAATHPQVGLHMEEGHHQNGSHQPPIHTGIAHARYPDKGAAAAVG